ncbi:hypothetical protein GCM10007897_34680 [Sphingobium jiangsuense]|uniref:Uncharacterized protein (DUF983 family) n=1 Tax=Sphingobium jiangsuense TaxID=870476 RepID=A0A7W6BML6_9SPHN|nr:DUF983 domain-containing protein [Sphingobium jiangsuense]MBB3925388.1 uncharacterized protein (DUF983 family) [Sphingobium jiangsuense]GLT02065.1 hypothetical protein GCM10007897_34680 [Sphingobium jiangsuense]
MTEQPLSHNHDDTTRPLRPAILSGLRGKCPACEKGPLFARFLKPAKSCAGCGEALDGHEADDFPAYIVILLLGHILVPVMIEVNHAFDIPLLWQSIIWPVMALLLAVAMIQPTKGAVIGLQWARRMHGFAAALPEEKDAAPLRR